MKIVFCAAEAAPLAKVGGLGDVVGSLPKALASLGLEPIVVLPRYGFIQPQEAGLRKLPQTFSVPVLGKHCVVEIWEARLPGSQVKVYLLENTDYFAARQEVYPSTQPHVEAEGFLLLSKAVLELLRVLDIRADILHLHDWHTAFAAVELAELRRKNSFFEDTRSILTLHNVAYQGVYAGVNNLREGLSHADFITAVSPTYAREIQTPEGGAGLDWLLRQRDDRVLGILNGIDTSVLNPDTDVFIPETYNRETYVSGKSLCKRVLQQELGLPIKPEVPLIGMVNRLVEQKGLDLLLPVMELLSKRPAQWVFLGSGDPVFENMLREMNARYVNVRNYIGFNLALAQKIYAGSDMFLMPSRFEPCGLGQMIALRYGSVPVVRATGGLADTIVDIRRDYELGNGFSFEAYSSSALVDTLDAALSYFKDEATWHHLVRNGMAEDFGWERSAKAYRELYQRVSREQPQTV